MTALTQTVTAPLGYSRKGLPIPLPESIVDFVILKETRGCPKRLYGDDNQPLTISVHGDVDDLRMAVGDEPGWYRLVPRDQEGRKHPQVAHCRIEREHYQDVSDEARPTIPGGYIPADMAFHGLNQALSRCLATTQEQTQILKETLKFTTSAMVDITRHMESLTAESNRGLLQVTVQGDDKYLPNV